MMYCSKGYPVSKMLIVLSTVFIWQDSQRACIHFVGPEQMGSLSFLYVYVCVCNSDSSMLICAFIYAVMINGLRICICSMDPFAALKSEGQLKNRVMMDEMLSAGPFLGFKGTGGLSQSDTVQAGTTTQYSHKNLTQS